MVVNMFFSMFLPSSSLKRSYLILFELLLDGVSPYTLFHSKCPRSPPKFGASLMAPSLTSRHSTNSWLSKRGPSRYAKRNWCKEERGFCCMGMKERAKALNTSGGARDALWSTRLTYQMVSKFKIFQGRFLFRKASLQFSSDFPIEFC